MSGESDWSAEMERRRNFSVPCADCGHADREHEWDAERGNYCSPRGPLLRYCNCKGYHPKTKLALKETPDAK